MLSNIRTPVRRRKHVTATPTFPATAATAFPATATPTFPATAFLATAFGKSLETAIRQMNFHKGNPYITDERRDQWKSIQDLALTKIDAIEQALCLMNSCEGYTPYARTNGGEVEIGIATDYHNYCVQMGSNGSIRSHNYSTHPDDVMERLQGWR